MRQVVTFVWCHSTRPRVSRSRGFPEGCEPSSSTSTRERRGRTQEVASVSDNHSPSNPQQRVGCVGEGFVWAWRIVKCHPEGTSLQSHAPFVQIHLLLLGTSSPKIPPCSCHALPGSTVRQSSILSHLVDSLRTSVRRWFHTSLN